MVCCSKGANCAFQEIQWEIILSRRSIAKDWLDTLGKIRSFLLFLRIITRHNCSKMGRSVYKVADYVRWQKEWSRIMDCINHFLYQRSRGRMLAWISFLVYQGHIRHYYIWDHFSTIEGRNFDPFFFNQLSPWHIS